MSLILHAADLAPIVAQALGKSAVTLTEWRAQPLAAGGSQMVGGLGIQRVTGMAQTAEGLLPLVVDCEGIAPRRRAGE